MGKSKGLTKKNSNSANNNNNNTMKENNEKNTKEDTKASRRRSTTRFSKACLYLSLIGTPLIGILLYKCHLSIISSGAILDQDVPLAKPYSMDFNRRLEIRMENMKKYNYAYNKFGIDKRSNLSLQEYRDVYDGIWPVVVTDILPKWKASNWTKDFFLNNYGLERITMKAVHGPSKKGSSFALPLSLFHEHSAEGSPTTWTYLEDELFIPTRPELQKDIGSCIYLEEDFYQLFPLEVRPWNAMLLWGTKYSRSTLHMDPYNWTGTNAVIIGQKRWKLYPPGQDEFFYVFDGIRSNFPLDCYKYNSPIDTHDVSETEHPLFQYARSVEFDQLPGDLLLIPTGWFHQAYNVEETIAVSSQVMNSNNYRVVLEEILKVGNVQRSQLPSNIDSLPPAEQVRTIMSLLPKSILKRGKEVTADILKQVKGGLNKPGYNRPNM